LGKKKDRGRGTQKGGAGLSVGTGERGVQSLEEAKKKRKTKEPGTFNGAPWTAMGERHWFMCARWNLAQETEKKGDQGRGTSFRLQTAKEALN